jgi:hypothetical protein
VTIIDQIQEQVIRIKGAAEQRHIQELQLKLWPDWPDDRRGAPNTVVRSAVFGVVRRGRRQRITDMPVAGPQGWSITMTGWRLDQHDCDIWLEVMHLARNSSPGGEVRFTLHSLLRRLGRKGQASKGDYSWMEQRLKHLAATTIAFENKRYIGVMGALISSFRIDRETGEGIVRTNPEIRPLFESVTHLNIEQRRTLGANQLAKALHAAFGSHVDWLPMLLETLMHRVGAEYHRIRDFKRDLKLVLDDFITRGWLRSYQFTESVNGELLELIKVATPTQERMIEARRLLPQSPEP